MTADAVMHLRQVVSEQVPANAVRFLSSARWAGADAVRAGVRRLLLTHPPARGGSGTRRPWGREASSRPIDVATPGQVIDLS